MGIRVLLATVCVGALVAPAHIPAPATAPPPALPQAAADPGAPDFDRDGKADLAAATVGPSNIHVWYGSGAERTITAAELGYTGDDLEWALSGPMLARDLNRDGYTDLAFATRSVAPALNLVFGSPTGLDLGTRHVTALPVPATGATAYALAQVTSPKRRLAVSVSAENFPSRVLVYDLDGDGHPAGTPITLRNGRGKLPQLSDRNTFGRSLASSGDRLFIGVNGATVNGKAWAGAVVAATFSDSGVKSARTVTQGTTGVAGVVGKLDEFGTSLATRGSYLVVGTRGDDVGTIRNTGSVQVFSLAGGGLRPLKRIAQSSPGVPGKAEPGDAFGYSVALGTVCPGVTSVIIGGPQEAVLPRHENDGAVWLVPLTKAAGCSARQLYEGHGLGGTPRDGYGLGGFVAVLRDAGSDIDEVVLGAHGSYSEGPIGFLVRWSPTSGEVSRQQALFRAVAGR